MSLINERLHDPTVTDYSRVTTFVPVLGVITDVG